MILKNCVGLFFYNISLPVNVFMVYKHLLLVVLRHHSYTEFESHAAE